MADSYNLFDDDLIFGNSETVEQPEESHKDLLTEQRELTDRLDEASKLYYQGKQSEFSDTEFDLQLHRLEDMEKQTGTIFPNSPTQRVGSDIQDGFDKVKHPIPMLTIDNVYKSEQLNKWLEKTIAEHPEVNGFEVSTKFDGVSLELHYHKGVLVSASTRGDKLIGDDVTVNAKTIRDIPLTLHNHYNIESRYSECQDVYQIEMKEPLDIYVRGEVMMRRSVLNELNQELAARGEKLFANCRNACSGSLKAYDSSVTAKRKLIFRPWDVLFFDANGKRGWMKCAKQAWFRANDFNCEEFAEILSLHGFAKDDFDVDWIISVVDEYKQKLDNSHPDFDYDGVVIKIEDDGLREQIGTHDHKSVDWAIARKWNEEREAITLLESVTWQVGRQGAVTPVGNIRPVPVDGVTASNVTLHNPLFVLNNGLMQNGPIKITRSGGVIPYCLGTPLEDEYRRWVEQSGIKDFKMIEGIETPTHCPVCGAELVLSDDFKSLQCPNKNCPAQVNGRIENWCSKDVMNIQDIGPEVIADMVEKNVICEPLDLYDLEKNYTPEELADCLGAGYGEKSIKKYYKNIRLSKTQPLERIISGLSIDGIGKQNARNLVKAFKSFENLMNASEEELKDIDGIGDVLAANIRQFMTEDGQYWLDKMTEIGLQLTAAGADEQPGPNGIGPVLEGLKIVFSGASKYFPGDSAEDFLESFGAKCGHSVSKKTNYLVIGESPGPKKLQTAKELGIEILHEDEFYKKFSLKV